MWPRIAVRVISVVTAVVLLVDVMIAVVAGKLVTWLYVGVGGSVTVGTLALAGLIARQRPTNVVAPLLCWMALLVALVSFSDNYLPAQVGHPDVLPELPGLAIAALVVTWVWLYVAVALLLLLFPDGRLPGPRWGWVAGGLPVVGLAVHVVMVVSPGPYGAPYADAAHPFGNLPSEVTLALKVVLFPTLMTLALGAAASLRVRFVGGDTVTRAQLKWMGLAALFLPGTFLLSWIGFLLAGTHDGAGVGLALLYAAVPTATAIAILRHDLYDVDRALSAALRYGFTSAALVTMFALSSLVSGVLLGRDSLLVAAAATALTAVALAPLRTRLQRQVDRRVYPLRHAALQAVNQLHSSVTADNVGPEQLEDVLRVALRDPSLDVLYFSPVGAGCMDSGGRPKELTGAATPVRVCGQQVGAIVSCGPAPVQLLTEVAAAAALLVEMGRLRLEVSEALREAEASRSRLLRLGYEERRRLERDLHDGAQQRLVSLGMSLRLAQRHLSDRMVDVDGLLDEAVTQLGTAVAELREVAHGMRPSCLDDGLHPALSALAESVRLPIDLDVAADRAIPDDIATTAYYVVSEAVANAVKHAEASHIGLRIVQDEGQLRIYVEDDGRGGAAVRPGSGLAGLTDRVAAAGGSLLVRSEVGHGTVLEAVLPCAS